MVDLTCRECAYVFEADPAFYAGRGLELPTRCRRCRQARKAARVKATVTFFDVNRGFGFAMTDQGTRVYWTHRDVSAPDDLPLASGARITCEVLPPQDAARSPRARSVVVVRE